MRIRAAVIALVVAAGAHAQLTESIEVRITNVDVVVTDRKGNPVPGLTRDDFEILEDGKAQPLTNFYEIRGDAAVPVEDGSVPAPGPVAPAPPEVTQRRIVIFVDNLSIHPFARNGAVESLEKALGNLMRPGDEAMVAFWNRGLRVAVPFTSDREQLMTRLRAEVKSSAAPRSMELARSQIIEAAAMQIRDIATSRGRKDAGRAYSEALSRASTFAEELRAAQIGLMEDVKRTTATLAGLEGKKALIFLGGSLDENPGLEIFAQIEGMFKGVVPSAGKVPVQFTQSGRNLSRELREIAVEANSNNVTMYMIDTADRDALADPASHMPDAEAVTAAYTNTPMAMSNIAALTGGLFMPGGEGFDAALKTVVNDLSSYYSLGYRSPDQDKGSRRIVVKVKRDGLRVRSRASYVAKDADEDVQDRVVANVFHPGVKGDFPVSVDAGQPVRQSRGRYKVPITVTMPSSFVFIPQDGELKGEFAVHIATGKEHGALSDVSKAVQPMTFPADAQPAIDAQKTFTYTTTLVVNEGEQIVSVGVTDTVAGTSGFARTKVTAK